MRNRLFTILFLAAGAAWSQTPAAAPAPPPAGRQFDVATIKLAPPINPAAAMAGKLHVGMSVDGARVDIGYMSLSDLILMAYKVKQHQLTGPDWMKNQRFDILAKMPEGGTKEQVPEMLQALLKERFGLTFHKEMREQPVYGLVVGKGGPHVKESAKEEEAPPKADDKGGNTISFGGGQIRQSGNSMVMKANDRPGTTKMTMADGKMKMESTQVKMEDFAEMLTRFVGKPVVDMTELKGAYDLSVEISMTEMVALAQKAGIAMPGMVGAPPAGDAGRPADAASDPSASGSIFASIQQLGLKLESRKAPVDTMVVDKLEKAPTEN